MSQNRTIVPGMEGTTPSVNEASKSFYSRETSGRVNGTVTPGMSQFAPGAQPEQGIKKPSIKYSEKPVAGFLFSISRQGIGEYWPLYIGPNTIGSSPKCDIYLKEGTVSSDHAVIVVRHMKNPEKTVASINDTRSTNGTMINGISLAFNAQECFNGDIITIGENYELVLILIDTKALGLKIAENFIAIEEQSQEVYQFEQGTIAGPYTKPVPTKTDSDSSKVDFYMPDDRPTEGTVSMDGSRPSVSGGTVPM